MNTREGLSQRPQTHLRSGPRNPVPSKLERAHTRVVRTDGGIPRESRELRNGHQAAVVWLTGMPAVGKTTIARGLELQLSNSRHLTVLLDGDELRLGLSADLGFSPADRTENIRRAGEVARVLFDQGAIVLCAFVSPYRDARARVRSLLPRGRFIEIFVKADVDTCRGRDPVGLYARAYNGQLDQFTGVSAPYEEPVAPELTVDTRALTVAASVDMVLDLLRARGLLKQR